ncbi:MAG TPA: ParB/RepB/Spo0J family partition protein, partial [Pseudomonadales bacterium]|nr:ParB/RepB/Spo0J family partition protein [Pseudomonadales bacterium]
SALFGDDAQDYATLDRMRDSKTVPIEHLRSGKFQPRRRFDPEALQSLVDSIREKGVLEPILVRRHPDDPNAFEIVAGERRWRAAQAAGLHEVPVSIKEIDDRDALEIGLVENLQREDLTAIEEAEGYRRLMDQFGHTQEDVAKRIGKSRSHVANTLRLLGLPEGVRVQVQEGSLSAGHARALIGAEDPTSIARTITKKALNVRQTEALVRRERGGTGDGARRGRPAKSDKDPNTAALERDLSNLLGLKVEIDDHGDSGMLKLHYSSLEQLDDLLHRLTRGGDGD